MMTPASTNAGQGATPTILARSTNTTEAGASLPTD